MLVFGKSPKYNRKVFNIFKHEGDSKEMSYRNKNWISIV